MPSRACLIPCLRYDDAPAAIGFLCEAFGFTRHAVHPCSDHPGRIVHAELRHGDAMLMLASADPSSFADAAGLLTARAAGGVTQTLYLVVEDVDGHAERARAAGADIFMPPVANDYGGRGYSARDPEGNVWSVGSYDPLAT